MTRPVDGRYAAGIAADVVAAGSAPRLEDPLELDGISLDRKVDLDVVLGRIVDEIVAALGADRGTLYLVDHLRDELVSRVAHLPEIAEIRLRVGEGVAGFVARSGEVVNVARDADDPRRTGRIDALTGYRTESVLAAPVRRAPSEPPMAVLQVLNKKDGDFSAEDERRLVRMADRVAELLDATSLGRQLRPGQRLPLSFRFNDIVGESGAMREVYDRTARAAATDATVLLRGESGCGKGLVARAIHDNSRRRDGPFVPIDCAALPETLIENELFGHERGAFTGADSTRDGKVRAAQGGTLFLDEIGDVSPTVQAKLLTLVQNKRFVKVGGTKDEEADVRFVCATNRDLEEAIAAGEFRQDLYYRLRVVEIELPPLRDRGHADLDRLIDHFLFEFAERHERPGVRLTPSARSLLHTHAWPGNVRELEHCIESAVVLAGCDELGARDVPIKGLVLPQAASGGGDGSSGGDDGLFVTDVKSLREVELAYIRHVLDACDGNRSAAARLLGIGRNTLLRKISKDRSGDAGQKP